MTTSTFIAVFVTDGEGRGNYAKFVTSLGDHNLARWDKGKPAMAFSEKLAADIVFGLNFNGYTAAIVKAPKGVEFGN